ncbi:MAG: type II toxin-antitoxin system VapC family toxin [Gemmatimonadetes bacterium]|nr:type II toxin-antitoxin system VapC family toxin [Gemmatimonadota bacterium]MYD14887.1 type II toxin-antitoxin system VapC family toxin [Gemmatimonadota bacterium]MYI66716.1 type II toxin-antitoxin system VapC family toxin [Gemmatimonadota bacterium]
MRLLLDTHAFVWWIADSCRLSERACALIADESHDVFVSAASAWELATKYRLQELDLPELAAFDMAGAIDGQGFRELPIRVQDASLAGRLPGPHRDPFDRMLIAQSLAHGLALVSRDAVFDGYGVTRVW